MRNAVYVGDQRVEGHRRISGIVEFDIVVFRGVPHYLGDDQFSGLRYRSVGGEVVRAYRNSGCAQIDGYARRSFGRTELQVDIVVAASVERQFFCGGVQIFFRCVDHIDTQRSHCVVRDVVEAYIVFRLPFDAAFRDGRPVGAFERRPDGIDRVRKSVEKQVD